MTRINFGKMGGLVPVVIQDADSNEVMMVGFMNEEAYQLTLKTGKVHFWSRTREKLWLKGETSGVFLWVLKILLDCDEDTLLIFVNSIGPICHNGTRSCFYQKVGQERRVNQADFTIKTV
jgi:phosphoribosyl-AMP cyclohydrolase